MKFCDKLPKLRKENNLSQELLADKLGVSRQAVSKWENGSSYPDMEKMIEICKVLNCTLDDLFDDGIISKNNTSRFNVNDYFRDFLKFVTQTYNMFCAMKFTNKIKCILELVLISFVLYILSLIVYTLIDSFLFNLFIFIPKIGIHINSIFESIFILILFVISFIIFIHLFKIRYLDYYITIPDNSIIEKQIEEEEKEFKDKKDAKKEKIIIRDPEHTNFSFLMFLGKVLLTITKIMFAFLLVFLLIIFALAVATLFAGIYHIKYGIIFLFLTIIFVGISTSAYSLIYSIYNFITSTAIKYKRMFIIFIIGIIMFGAGLGLSISTYVNLKENNVISEKYLKSGKETVKMKENLVLLGDNIDYEINNAYKDIIIVSNKNLGDLYTDSYNYENYEVVDTYTYIKDTYYIKILYDNLKNNQRPNYEKEERDQIKVYVSNENYKKLMNNHQKYISFSNY